MLVWLGVRSSSTPTGAGGLTEAAHSQGRTTPRWTARLPTPPAGWPSLWWLPASASASWSKWVDTFPPGRNGEDAESADWFSGVLRHRGGPATVRVHIPLRNLPEERGGAAGDCQQELWSPPRSYREVSCRDFNPASTRPREANARSFSASGIWTWRSPSIRTPLPTGTLGAASFRGRSRRSWSFRIHPGVLLSPSFFFLPSAPQTQPPVHVCICRLWEIEVFFF